MHRSKSREPVNTMPGPTFMSPEKMGDYLRDLRTARPPRPNGSRPLPVSSGSNIRRKPSATRIPEPVAKASLPSPDLPSRASSALSHRPRLSEQPPRSSSVLAHRSELSQQPPRSSSVLAHRSELSEQPPRSSSVLAHRSELSQQPPRSSSALSNRAAGSIRSLLGRPLVRDPIARARSRNSVVTESTNRSSSSKSSVLTPESPMDGEPFTYQEDAQRQMEKQEVRSLRHALEGMDMNEEQRVFSAAQDEAAELVWKHRNPNAASKELGAPYEYASHARRGSHAQSQSFGSQPVQLPTEPQSAYSGSGTNSSLGSRSSSIADVKVHDFAIIESEEKAPPAKDAKPQKPALKKTDSLGGLKNSVSFEIPQAGRKSSGSKRKPSGSLFQNPNDQIYEEPEEAADPAPAPAPESKSKPDPVPGPAKPAPTSFAARRNPFARVQFSRDNLARSNTDPQVPTRKFDRFEIHRNAPTRSRDAAYTSNVDQPTSPTKVENAAPTRPSVLDDPEEIAKWKNGKEVRSDDIRMATSMKLKDRSPKLPTPTMVSDSPGRPIVSFRSGWKPKEVELQGQQSTLPPIRPHSPPKDHGRPKPAGRASPAPPIPIINVPDEPSINVSTPPIPTICVPDDPPVPSINVPAPPTINVSSAPPIPTINVSPSTNPLIPTINAPSTRPLPTPSKTNPPGRPLPRHANTAPASHFTPANIRSSALCAHCQTSISGRIVTAGGARFHPRCFRCHVCSEGLECVAFYPEPEAARRERFEAEGRPEGESEGKADMRFYCHLDYHEIFSPKCKSCKTPIEGEVVVACGAEWHVGHFFCAECGFTFDASTPFVEKDGYAWCVDCHTTRYSTKCKKCRRPVTDTVVKALGAEWHTNCFVCMECSGPFVDGRYFLRGESRDPVCVGCEERRLKA